MVRQYGLDPSVVEPAYIGNHSHKFIHFKSNEVDFIANLILPVATSRL